MGAHYDYVQLWAGREAVLLSFDQFISKYEAMNICTVGVTCVPAVKCTSLPVSLTQWNSISRAWARISGDIISSGKLFTNFVDIALKISNGATSKSSVSLCLQSVVGSCRGGVETDELTKMTPARMVR